MHRVSLLMLAAFLAVQLAAWGLGVAFLAVPPENPFPNPSDVGNSYVLFAYVLISAAAILLILKYYRGSLFFLLVEGLLLFLTMQILLSFILSFYASVILALSLAGLRFLVPRVRPFFLAAATAVVGALLGSWLDLVPAAVLAALLSAYDVAAVFFTKHMIALAKGLSSRGASFSVSVSAKSSKAAKTEKSVKKSRSQKQAGKQSRQLESIELGTGDLVIPAMLIVASLNESIYQAAAAFTGAGAGFIVLLYLLERRKGYWPALPPIVGGCLGGILLFNALKLLAGAA